MFRIALILLSICIVCQTGAQSAAKNQNKPDTSGVICYFPDSPEFPGGEQALKRYIPNHINYAACRNDTVVTGRIVVTFVVSKDGQVKDARIIKARKGTEGFQKEVIRIVLGMPKWKPGMMNGKPVDVQFNLPVDVFRK